jgi:Nucleotidyltransferase domain
VTADPYLQAILLRETVNTGPLSPVRGVQLLLQSVISEWANVYLASVSPSGSFAKGTANRSGTDIDLFISLSPTTNETLKQIHDTLFNKLTERGYAPKRQNVSLNIKVGSYSVDLVPGKRQTLLGDDHSLYRRKADTWTKTNITTHINHVRAAGCASEIRILKLWRDQKRLDFPSFYLELTAIKALSAPRVRLAGTLSDKVWSVFTYLRDEFPDARVVDPANSNNVISDDLTAAERGRIKAAASQTLQAGNWNQIVV